MPSAAKRPQAPSTSAAAPLTPPPLRPLRAGAPSSAAAAGGPRLAALLHRALASSPAQAASPSALAYNLRTCRRRASPLAPASAPRGGISLCSWARRSSAASAAARRAPRGGALHAWRPPRPPHARRPPLRPPAAPVARGAPGALTPGAASAAQEGSVDQLPIGGIALATVLLEVQGVPHLLAAAQPVGFEPLLKLGALRMGDVQLDVAREAALFSLPRDEAISAVAEECGDDADLLFPP
mmetsp:Transcript_53533/g.150391  ORF Transcript_53533/g.150391 Transcript_53533/m.150391 type:complete len:240 (+) Transcript_53533:114-833(+)